MRFILCYGIIDIFLVPFFGPVVFLYSLVIGFISKAIVESKLKFIIKLTLLIFMLFLFLSYFLFFYYLPFRRLPIEVAWQMARNSFLIDFIAQNSFHVSAFLLAKAFLYIFLTGMCYKSYKEMEARG